jgi:hypothetical protein
MLTELLQWLTKLVGSDMVYKTRLKTGCSVSLVDAPLWEQDVAGSNPATPTHKHHIMKNGQRP